MLSGNGESPAPFLQPNSSHQMNLRLKYEEEFLRALIKSEETLAMHAADKAPVHNKSLAIDDRTILKILSDELLDIKNPGEQCSILFDVINYNSEIEKQAVAVDCIGVLSDLSANYGK